jgi:MCM P-loop domain
MQKHKPDTIRLAFKEWFVGGESPDTGEQRAYCPMCEDPATSKTPSASFNPDKGLWNCTKSDHGGSTLRLAAWLKDSKGWNLTSALMRARNNDPSWTKRKEAGQAKAGKRTTPLPTEQEITAWNSRLLKSPRILEAFRTKRGIDNETIDDYMLGWNGTRYTIPIYDIDGELVNVRQYKIDPRAGEAKMLNVGGHGDACIYGVDEIADFGKIIITEGEMDCLLLRQYLREGEVNDYCVISTTAGAGVFPLAWGPLFSGKDVWVCYDADSQGRVGARKTSKVLEHFADNVYIINIPEHPKLKGTDVTDYLYGQGFGIEEFLTLMKEAAPSSEIVVEPLQTSGKKMSLRDTLLPESRDGVIEVEASVIGKRTEPFSPPKTINATCDVSKGAVCLVCPLSTSFGKATVELRVDDERLMKFVEVSDTRYSTLLREVIGARCSDRVEFEVPKHYNLQNLVVQASVDDRTDGKTQTPLIRPLFALGETISGVNEKIRVVGRNVRDPRDNSVRFLSWINDKMDVDIDQFKLTPYIRSQLEIFQPDNDQMPLQKCLEIAHDLADNVTQIYGRDILHVAYDLTFHSVLAFKVGNLEVDKGWIEMMVVGDTRTGKSKIANRLTRHYCSGRVFSCEGASFAGIVGGNQRVDNQWFLTWGIVPLNDRRLVVLDEVTGMAEKNIIEQMSSIRSEGVAQITKIADGQTSARTRLIWITNPKEGTLREGDSAGISALQDIVKLEEDQSRFDYVCAARRNDVDQDIILDPNKRAKSPKYSSEACELLVKWVWSLTRKDVLITATASRLSFREAKRLGSEYIPSPPLIQIENVREKILRIACALAARTFSCDENGKLLVMREHIVDAVKFLDTIYGDEAMGYKFKSAVAIEAREKAEKRKGVVKAWLLEHEETVLHALKVLHSSRTFRPQRDFHEIGTMDELDAKAATNVLINENMIVNKGKGDYAMTEALREVLKEIEMDKMR